ncbi:hypothetical protein SAMN05421747_12428 [Parapedobacter composti]|uniref:Uncharacterized protein n=1 Tax=Parapedobacter composti TaxID=623281 RepID=A0A1I1LVG4_9SPHI|nr:hypothetical protein SAMN05421747_12428 [Parapedobacter composti]
MMEMYVMDESNHDVDINNLAANIGNHGRKQKIMI